MGQAHLPTGKLRTGRANDFMGVPLPVVALARDLPPSHEIDWHDQPRFQLVYAARGVMTVDTHGVDAAPARAPPHRQRRGPAPQPLRTTGRRDKDAAQL